MTDSKAKIKKLIEKNKWNPRFPKDPNNLYNPHYEPFLKLLLRYDFLRVSDIKTLLCYKNARNVRWYVSALKELDYIGCVQFNNYYYYFIKKAGIEILHSVDPSVPKNLNRTPAGMLVFAAHNSAATEVMMSFIEHDNVPNSGLLLWRGPIECESLYPYDDGSPKIIPDALGYFTHDGGESSFNLELDSGKQNLQMIDAKIRNYLTYFHLHGYKADQQIIMFVTLLNKVRVQNIINTVNLYLKEAGSRMRVIVATMEDIKKYGPYADIWYCNLTNGKQQHNLFELSVFESRKFDPTHFLGHEEVIDGRRDLLRAVRSDMQVNKEGLLIV